MVRRVEGNRRPGMVDVAKLAGVSHQTVSRVINGSDKVRPETVERVRAAINQLGYRPNTAARALVTRRSGVVGIVNTSTGKFGPTQMQLAIEMAARDNGFSPSVSPMAGHTSGAMRQAIDHLLAVDVEGIVIIAPLEEMVHDLHPSMVHVPVVAVTSTEVARQMGYIAACHDQEAGVRAAMEHLIDLGHRDIVHVSGPLDWYEARARLRTWEAVLTEQGLDVPAVIHGDWNPESGRMAARALLKKGLPDAVFATNDEVALGMIHEFLAAGVSIPDDISIVGFDDNPLSAYFTPGLTTVRQDFQALGQRVMDTLAILIRAEQPEAVPDITLEPKLVIRQSTGPAPSAR